MGFRHSMLLIKNVSAVIQKIKEQFTMLIYLQARTSDMQKRPWIIVFPETVNSLLPEVRGWQCS